MERDEGRLRGQRRGLGKGWTGRGQKWRVGPGERGVAGGNSVLHNVWSGESKCRVGLG